MSQPIDHLSGEVQRPANLDWSKMGWGLESQNEDSRHYTEQLQLDQAMAARPSCYQQRPARSLSPEVSAKWEEFQRSRGYDEGSCDLTLFGEFFHGNRYRWQPQKTGSCTISNTFRMFYRRYLWEILAQGQLERPLGTTEYGPSSVSFYAPLSYGIARQIAGIRRGDGGFCAPTIQSLMDGVLACNNPKLLNLLRQLGAAGEKDFPEPQANAIYRAFQSWTYNDMFRNELKTPLLESVKCLDAATLITNLEQYKPAIMCSMLAVKKGGSHQGLTYFIADRNDSWAHNMCWGGKIIWHGRTFLLLSNESWPGAPIYPIPVEEVEDMIFPRYRPEVMTLGEIDLEDQQIAA